MIDFNKKIDRNNNDSRKWDGIEKDFGKKDVFPMWVADMDLECPEFVVEALKNKADQKIFGYTMEKDEYFESLINWVKRRHGYTLDRKKMAHSPTVITSLNLVINMITEVGDNILIQTPTYPQFVKQIEKNNREVLENKLIETENSYEIDFIDFEEKLKKSKVFILCNPHNPSGRVWKKEELEQIANLCVKYNVKLISDEIHSDLILDGKHLSVATLNDEIKRITYTFLSSTKTFNLAGLQSSFAIFPTVEEKIEFVDRLSMVGVHEPNSFCMDMVISAYNNGDEWLGELLDHIRGNIEFAIDYINENLPKMKVKTPEATYLLWLDFRGYNLTDEEINENLVERGGLGLNMGIPFMGSGFARMNIACPRYMLEEGLKRLKVAMNNC